MDRARDDERRMIAALLVDLQRVLARLDEIGAPGDVGAHLDLAIDRLEKFIDQDPPI